MGILGHDDYPANKGLTEQQAKELLVKMRQLAEAYSKTRERLWAEVFNANSATAH